VCTRVVPHSYRQLDGVLRHIRSRAAKRLTGELSDRELLERFVAGRDQAAFAAIVERHRPLVLRREQPAEAPRLHRLAP
jgi:hypothetical protein